MKTIKIVAWLVVILTAFTLFGVTQASARKKIGNVPFSTGLSYTAQGGSTEPTTSIQKSYNNSPISAKYTLPDVWYLGVPTLVRVELRYNSKRKFKYTGVSMRKAPTYRKVFRNSSFVVKPSLDLDFTTGSSQKDYELGRGLSRGQDSRPIKLRPNKTKTVKFWVVMDQCHAWPTPQNADEAYYLKTWTGFDSQPVGYQCVPPLFSVGYEGKIRSRGYLKKGVSWFSESDGSFSLFQIPIINPSATP